MYIKQSAMVLDSDILNLFYLYRTPDLLKLVSEKYIPINILTRYGHSSVSFLIRINMYTFNNINISIITRLFVLLVGKPEHQEKTTDFLYVTNKLDHTN